MLSISTQQILSLADIKQVALQRYDYVNSKEVWVHAARTYNPRINPPIGGLHRPSADELRNVKVKLAGCYIGETPSFVNSPRAWSGFW